MSDTIDIHIHRAFDQGEGILRLTPTWVPREFCIPGRRIKLHPDDYYAFGTNRGGIDERWLASTTPAANGPLTSPGEGLSQVLLEDSGEVKTFPLRDAVATLGAKLVGARIWEQYQAWPMYSKFFDNMGALPFHIHHRDEHAALVGQNGKPEAYYFPPQLNNHAGDFAFTFFGLETGVTREQVRDCLANFAKRDNRITALSRAYRLEIGTGWDIPPGILHAPGSLCTYEPQKASDIFAMFENVVHNQVIPEELLWKNTPQARMGDLDFLLEIVDWDANLDPDFRNHHLMIPKPVRPLTEMREAGYEEKWICYRSDSYSAKELTILPGRSVTIRDEGAYGLITMQGRGRMNQWTLETPALIRFGQLTRDEYFVSEEAARTGIELTNESDCDPLVMLKHFGPGNPDLAEVVV